MGQNKRIIFHAIGVDERSPETRCQVYNVLIDSRLPMTAMYVGFSEKDKWRELGSQKPIKISHWLEESKQTVPGFGIKKYFELAHSFMKEIMYDNGMVDRFHPEVYPEVHVKNIALAIGEFLESNELMYDELTSDNTINFISTGEETEVQTKYGALEGFAKLHTALNNYFDNTDSTDESGANNQ